MKILVINGHPTPSESSLNSHIIKYLGDEGIEFTKRNLIELYPDYNIDVDTERKLLMETDIVVLQFPFYWYSVPAILKQWMDSVISYGFVDARILAGETWITSVTVGSAKEGYQPGQRHKYTMDEFLRPLEQTATLMGMKYEKVYTYSKINERDTVDPAIQAHEHAKQLALLIRLKYLNPEE